MYGQDNAQQRWTKLTGERSSFYDRCQEYSKYTLPRILVPDHYNQNNSELNFGWSSFPAQAVNTLANKIMMALFKPGSPFVRLEPSKGLLNYFQQTVGMDEDGVKQVLAEGEQTLAKTMEKSALRPKLNEIVLHLIITGNGLLFTGPKKGKERASVRYFGLDKYCVKRSANGDVLEIVVREQTTFGQLKEEIQAVIPQSHKPEDKVCQYSHICRKGDGSWTQDTYIDDTKLPDKFGGAWPNDRKCPWNVITWSLSEGSDYGTGLVEDYWHDIYQIHELARCLIQGIQLASEYRWVVNPSGQTSVEDLERSINGDVIPGAEGDIRLIQSGTVSTLGPTEATSEKYMARVGRGFLMGSGGVRDAERVTAEEIRMIANDLEKSLGGTYTRLAEDFQRPLAYWLLDTSDLPISGEGIEPVIITGLDALSRNSDIEKIKLLIGDLAAIANLPPAVQQLIKMDQLISIFAVGYGIDKNSILLSKEQIEQLQAAQQQQALEQAQMPPEMPAQAVQPAPPIQ